MKKKSDWRKLGSLKFWLALIFTTILIFIGLIGKDYPWFSSEAFMVWLATLEATFIGYVISNVASKKHKPKQETEQK